MEINSQITEKQYGGSPPRLTAGGKLADFSPGCTPGLFRQALETAFQTRPVYNKRVWLLILVALVSSFLLLPAHAAGATRVRVLHLAPEAGKVEVWVEGRLINESLGFLEDTGYIELSPGENRIVCKTTGEDDPVILNSQYPLREDKDYTISLTGRESDKLQLTTSIDSCPPQERLAQLNFTDGVPGSPAIDLSIRYGPVLYKGLSFRTSGGCQFIPPDEYVLKFTESRTGRTLAEREITLKEGTRYNLFATGDFQGDDFRLVTFEEENKPEREPQVFGVDRSVLQLLGAGLIASVLILVLGRQ